MGGYSSSRWGWYRKKNTANESWRIAIKNLRPAIGAVMTGLHVWWGVIGWTWDGQPFGNIACQVENKAGALAMRLLYKVTDGQTGQESNYDYRVGLHTTPILGGAVKWWFNCPSCVRRCGTLYLPPGALGFACRHCHKLTYASCQKEHRLNVFDRMIAAGLLAEYPELTTEEAARLFRCDTEGKRIPKKVKSKLRTHALQNFLEKLASRPQPYANYLTATELCERSGLTPADLVDLEAARLLLADRPSGKYHPKLASWAGKLAYLLRAGWAIPEIKAWARGRWSNANPRAWPPAREEWQQCVR